MVKEEGSGGRVSAVLHPFRGDLCIFLPSGLFSLPSSDGHGLDLEPQNASRRETGSSVEEESLGKGSKGGERTHCVRA
jgi:hypothetical protein